MLKALFLLFIFNLENLLFLPTQLQVWMILLSLSCSECQSIYFFALELSKVWDQTQRFNTFLFFFLSFQYFSFFNTLSHLVFVCFHLCLFLCSFVYLLMCVVLCVGVCVCVCVRRVCCVGVWACGCLSLFLSKPQCHTRALTLTTTLFLSLSFYLCFALSVFVLIAVSNP